jgi:hypothetical protein
MAVVNQPPNKSAAAQPAMICSRLAVPPLHQSVPLGRIMTATDRTARATDVARNALG